MGIHTKWKSKRIFYSHTNQDILPAFLANLFLFWFDWTELPHVPAWKSSSDVLSSVVSFSEVSSFEVPSFEAPSLDWTKSLGLKS